MDWLLYDRDLFHGRVNLHVERDCLEKLQEYYSDPRLLGRFKLDVTLMVPMSRYSVLVSQNTFFRITKSLTIS